MNSEANYSGVVIVIPTRNRAQLAMNAVRSVLDQPVNNLQVMVSDNSTSEPDREEVSSFCVGLNDARLSYVRPPESLAMTAHWDWAIEQALAGYSASHFLYLTDRMMFRRGALKEILDLAVLYGNKIISYNHDRICDDIRPIRFEQYPGTAKLIEVQTSRLSWLVSQSILHHGLPRMLNCIVPREVLDRMRRRFGNVFASIAPDFNFCFRSLDVEDSILFFDKSPIFHYALNRSNGASVSRGEMTPDNADFTANLPVDNSIRNYATPIPQLNTAVNAVFNEYLIYKQESMSPRFFDLDVQKYLRANAVEMREVRDPQLRAEMHVLLEKHGYREVENDLPPASPLARLKRARPRSVLNFLARRVGIASPPDVSLEFGELDEAIDYARNVSRGNWKNWTMEAELLQGRELPASPAPSAGASASR
jgi:glycosyltransferase involved in cell wall biosynthesis